MDVVQYGAELACRTSIMKYFKLKQTWQLLIAIGSQRIYNSKEIEDSSCYFIINK